MTTQILEQIEPTQCAQCPFWQPSDRTPNVGHCSTFDHNTLGHDVPADLCIVEFWRFAASPTPAHSPAIKIAAIIISLVVTAVAVLCSIPAHAVEDGIQESPPPLPPMICRTKPTHPQCGNT